MDKESKFDGAKHRRPLWLLTAYAIGNLVILVSLVVGVGLSVDYGLHSNQIKNARELAIGDSSERVRDVLGKPINKWPPGSDRYTRAPRDLEIWYYGRIFSPTQGIYSGSFSGFIRDRRGPDFDDIVIEYGDDGNIQGIRVPGRTPM